MNILRLVTTLLVPVTSLIAVGCVAGYMSVASMLLKATLLCRVRKTRLLMMSPTATGPTAHLLMVRALVVWVKLLTVRALVFRV